MSHNVPDVGDVLGAKISKNKGNPFHTPLFLQAPKMWVKLGVGTSDSD